MRTTLTITLKTKAVSSNSPQIESLGITLSHNNFKFVQNWVKPFLSVIFYLEVVLGIGNTQGNNSKRPLGNI
jgi:hypothetical protein